MMVTVVLSSAEFFERGGTALSGSFVTVEDLVNDVLDRKIDEIWSVRSLEICSLWLTFQLVYFKIGSASLEIT